MPEPVERNGATLAPAAEDRRAGRFIEDDPDNLVPLHKRAITGPDGRTLWLDTRTGRTSTSVYD